ncbi:MAG: hypothetical protein NVSMB31_07150 [Vulcanimicrobiaceae bacterium]
MCALGLVGCGGGGSGSGAGAGTLLAPPLTPPSILPTPAPTTAPSSGWRLTVYYTAVLAYYSGPPQTVFGCSDLVCTSRNVLLGTFPSDFINVVKVEGTGKIASGSYLNWSGDVGYWLDTSSRDAQGNALVPYRTAAADPSIPFGTAFRVMTCGADTGTGTPTDAAVCSSLQGFPWVITDRFTVGAVGKHVDLYIGEQNSANFTSSAKFIDASNSVLQF